MATDQPGDLWQAGYWDAVEAGCVAAQRCSSGHWQFPGGPDCGRCGAPVEWLRVSGRGTVWSWAVFHHRYLESFLDLPYAVLIVDLDEGVRTYAAPDPRNVREPQIGARVQLTVGEYGGRRVPLAELLDGREGPG